MPHQQIARLLNDLEHEMRRINIWSDSRPSDAALASLQPFCVDTLNFMEWTQFIFIERMRQVIEQQHPLPSECGIAPMAEEYFKGQVFDGLAVITAMQAIDQILSTGNQN
ncbi:YqcC family protein [Aurantivibrio plasticivorans]